MPPFRMPIRPLAAPAIIAALLAGCGPGTPKEGEARIDTKAGTATVNLGEGAVTTLGTQAPPNLPAYAPVYPGATIQSSVNGIGGGPLSGMLALTTPDPADKVLAFYKKAAADAGLKMETEATTGQLKTFVARDGDKVANLTLAPQDGKTFAQLTYQ